MTTTCWMGVVGAGAAWAGAGLPAASMLSATAVRVVFRQCGCRNLDRWLQRIQLLLLDRDGLAERHPGKKGQERRPRFRLSWQGTSIVNEPSPPSGVHEDSTNLEDVHRIEAAEAV